MSVACEREERWGCDYDKAITMRGHFACVQTKKIENGVQSIAKVSTSQQFHTS